MLSAAGIACRASTTSSRGGSPRRREPIAPGGRHRRGLQIVLETSKFPELTLSIVAASRIRESSCRAATASLLPGTACAFFRESSSTKRTGRMARSEHASSSLATATLRAAPTISAGIKGSCTIGRAARLWRSTNVRRRMRTSAVARSARTVSIRVALGGIHGGRPAPTGRRTASASRRLARETCAVFVNSGCISAPNSAIGPRPPLRRPLCVADLQTRPPVATSRRGHSVMRITRRCQASSPSCLISVPGSRTPVALHGGPALFIHLLVRREARRSTSPRRRVPEADACVPQAGVCAALAHCEAPPSSGYATTGAR
jgi:hypothetical protein